jgi:hypothetical protein
MKVEAQKFHNLNPWPYKSSAELSLRQESSDWGHVSKLLHTFRDRRGQAARMRYQKKSTKSERQFLKKVTTWDTRA